LLRRFAKEGYLAVAPDLMARQGSPADYDDDVELMVKHLLRRVGDQQVMQDLDGVLDWALENGVVIHRVGISGFSWGGRWAWLFAAHSRRPTAVVSWYGVLDDQYSQLLPDRALFPHHPIELVERLQVPVLGLYAGQDSVIPMRSVDEMRAALARRPVQEPEVDFAVYLSSVHGFHADWRDDYDADAAADAWTRGLCWLRAHGV